MSISRPEDLDVYAIARKRRAVVHAQPYEGLDGSLVVGTRFAFIGYRETILEPGRIRFTIAHELGHLELHTSISQAIACTAGDIVAYRGSGMEQEANAFAAELLMPTAMLAEALKFASPTLQEAKKVAQRYGTSLTAASIRLVELIQYPAILIASDENIVRWVVKNSKANPYYTVQKGDTLHDDALAWNCLTELDEVEAPEEVPSGVWFGHDRDSYRLQVWEQSAILGSYGLVLTMLSLQEL